MDPLRHRPAGDLLTTPGHRLVDQRRTAAPRSTASNHPADQRRTKTPPPTASHQQHSAPPLTATPDDGYRREAGAATEELPPGEPPCGDRPTSSRASVQSARRPANHRQLGHRLAATAAGILVLVVGLGTATTVAHATSLATPASCPNTGETAMIDGFALTNLPDGLGGRTSEHTYTWGEVTFRNLVWESRLPDGAYRVDLNAHVLRGDRLTGRTPLRQFLTQYLERDPHTWQLHPVQLGDRLVLAADHDVFWLVRPGVAIWLSTRPGRLDRADLLAVADGVRETGEPSPTGSG